MKNKKVIFIIFGLIMWPIIIATPLVLDAYVKKLLLSEISFGEIPSIELYMGIISGFFAGIFFLGISYLISYLFFSKKKPKKITGPLVFFIITCLWILLLIVSKGGAFVNAITLEKEKVERIQQMVKDAKEKKNE
ncbi:hypothetical protein N9H42_00155 [Flavobacteriaceae bacterium]|nr:hypothetical protein [Flavobacteriaceae bacterium]